MFVKGNVNCSLPPVEELGAFNTEFNQGDRDGDGCVGVRYTTSRGYHHALDSTIQTYLPVSSTYVYGLFTACTGPGPGKIY